MPIYEYKCRGCGTTRDMLMDRPPEIEGAELKPILIACQCGDVMEKQMGRANFTTKPGRGFHGSKPKA